MVELPKLPSRVKLRFEAKRAVFTASETVRYQYRAARHPRRANIDMLLLTDFGAYTSDQQYVPIMRNSAELYHSCGINSAISDLSYGLKRPTSYLRKFDTVGLKLSYRTPADIALKTAAELRERISPSARLVYFDGDDDLNVQWPEVIGLADVYIKKHIFSDSNAYGYSYEGKSNLSDYVMRRSGKGYSDPNVSRSGPVSSPDILKIKQGWNIGLDDRVVQVAQRGVVCPRGAREIDICGRATASKDDWVFPLRQPMTEGLAKLADRFRVAIPTHRVPPDEYFRELRSSSICVSPFGWGEICWRDFEAILSGCLLVKPNMDHLATEPNIYVPGETYVPVAWDYSDLAEVCSRYLTDTEARERIVQRAQEVLLQALRPQWFVERLKHVLFAEMDC